MSQVLDALNLLDPELWVVTGGNLEAEQTNALVATFVSNASIDPAHPRFLVGLAKSHRTAELILEHGFCGLHLLTPDQADLAFHLGTQSGHHGDKLTEIPLKAGTSGVPLLENCLAVLEGQVVSVVDLGDRWLFVVMIIEAQSSQNLAPLRLHEWLDACSEEHHEILDALLVKDAYRDREQIEQWLNHLADPED